MLEHAISDPIGYVLVAVLSVACTLAVEWIRSRARGRDTRAAAETEFRRDLMERVKGQAKALAQCEEECARLRAQVSELERERLRMELELQRIKNAREG